MMEEKLPVNGYSTNFFRANDIVKILTGLWRPGSEKSIFIRIPYFFYKAFIFLIGIGYLICEYLIFSEMLKDIPKLLSYIGMCLTHTLGMFKLGIFVFRQKKVDKIMQDLQDDRYKYESLDEYGPSSMFLEEQQRSSRIAFLTFGMYSFVGISAHISAVIPMYREISGNTFEGTNQTCYNYMPYYFLIPFAADTKWKCMLAATFMDLGFAAFAWVIAYYDGVFVGLLKCFKVQLVIAGHVIVTIRQRCLRKLQLNEQLELLHDTENPKLEQELYRQLGHVIEHIKLLLGVRDDIEELLTFVTLGQTLSSLFIFASCMYVASIVPVSSPEFFAQMEFFSCVLVQLSIICWAGNEITLAGEYLGTALFDSDWFSCSQRFKTSMLLTMIRMHRPIRLSIGKFTPLTITTLVNVCRGSFSYFAVFKTVK